MVLEGDIYNPPNLRKSVTTKNDEAAGELVKLLMGLLLLIIGEDSALRGQIKMRDLQNK